MMKKARKTGIHRPIKLLPPISLNNEENRQAMSNIFELYYINQYMQHKIYSKCYLQKFPRLCLSRTKKTDKNHHKYNRKEKRTYRSNVFIERRKIILNRSKLICVKRFSVRINNLHLINAISMNQFNNLR